jgi:Tol biopolymer transport system component
MTHLLLLLALLNPLLTQQARPPAQEPNGDSAGPSISDDGRWIVFESRASNFVAGDVMGTWDVFLYDRKSGRVNRLSQGLDLPARSPQISGDGRWIVYLQATPNPTADSGGNHSPVPQWSVVLFDGIEQSRRHIGTSLVSLPDDPPRAPSISRDGGRVVFSGIEGPRSVVRLFEREPAGLTIASLGKEGAPATDDAVEPSISRNGRYVVFSSRAPDLAHLPQLSPDAQSLFTLALGDHQILVRDLEARTTTYGSHLAMEQVANPEFRNALISDDGLHVAYNHLDTRLIGGAWHVGFVSDLHARIGGRLLPPKETHWWHGPVVITGMAADGGHVLVETMGIWSIPHGGRAGTSRPTCGSWIRLSGRS